MLYMFEKEKNRYSLMAFVGNVDCIGLQPRQSITSCSQLQANANRKPHSCYDVNDNASTKNGAFTLRLKNDTDAAHYNFDAD